MFPLLIVPKIRDREDFWFLGFFVVGREDLVLCKGIYQSGCTISDFVGYSMVAPEKSGIRV